MDTEKVRAIKDQPIATSASEVRSFHSLASFYRLFVKDFSIIAIPLTEVMKKEVRFVWGKAWDVAFQKLKEILCTTSLLVLLDFSKTFRD